jgi:hypothetical protein
LTFFPSQLNHALKKNHATFDTLLAYLDKILDSCFSLASPLNNRLPCIGTAQSSFGTDNACVRRDLKPIYLVFGTAMQTLSALFSPFFFYSGIYHL